MSRVVNAMQAVMRTVIPHVPDRFVPGATPDPLATRKGGLVGASVPRVDGRLKVTGAARYAAEFPLEGMLYAAVVFSTIAKGRIVTLDSTAAAAAPGVILVVTAENAPRMKPMPVFLSSEKAAGPSGLPVLHDDRIHWNGQPVAVVLASTQEEADHAKSLVRVTYQAEPASTVFDEAKRHARVPAVTVQEPSKIEKGDAETAFAAAKVQVDVTVRTPRYNHNAIELHGVTVAWNGDELRVHDASQGVVQAAWTLAQVFGIEEEQVHVTSPFVGGGFGGKTVWFHHVLAAAAAKLAGRPVRLVLSREGVYRAVGGRTTTEQRVALGASEDGRLEALIHTGVAAMTPHNDCPEQFTFPARHVYAAKTIKLLQQVADMNMVANTFMRAPGESVGTFALETAIDELAERLKLDPIELRMRNEPPDDPTSELPFSSRQLVEAYRAGAERFGWDRRDPRPGARREGEWLVGMGCATATYPYQRMPGGAARLTLTRSGEARVEVPAHDMGMGTATAQAQVTAERLGLPLERVTVHYGDSRFPGAILAGGASQTVSIGAAVMAAHEALVTELIALAGKESPLAGLAPDDVESLDGALVRRDRPDTGETYATILARAGKEEVVVVGKAPLPLEMMHWSMHSFGAQFCEVRVNSVTGEIRVSRFVGSFDCGRILNPKTAASQLRGGIVMGLGLVLMEETLFDERTGRITNASLAEYHVPVHLDVPPIDILWTDLPDPHAPMGAHGVGEIGITGVAAAVTNAVYNATGRRIRKLPLTPERVLFG